jgi:DNA-directed RNA polymerase subunit alpha
VAETRVGQRTDYDRLTVQVETDGTITPEDAIAYAAALAQEHFQYFRDFGQVPIAPDPVEEDASIASDDLRERLERPIDDLGLSVRALNSLKNSSIRTLKDLVELAEEDLLKVKNVGEKALAEIGELLQREGLSFGMSFDASVASPEPQPMSDPVPVLPIDGGSQETL